MNASCKIDPAVAREAIECLLDESAYDLMDLFVDFIGRVLDSQTHMATLAAHSLIAERADHTYIPTPLGEAICQLDQVDILRKAADVILEDLRNRLVGPQAGVKVEADNAKEN
jgi:hypothetical protein